jgi:hypothetical protein
MLRSELPKKMKLNGVVDVVEIGDTIDSDLSLKEVTIHISLAEQQLNPPMEQLKKAIRAYVWHDYTEFLGKSLDGVSPCELGTPSTSVVEASVSKNPNKIQIVFDGIDSEIIDQDTEFNELLTYIQQYPFLIIKTKNMTEEAGEKLIPISQIVLEELQEKIFDKKNSTPVLKDILSSFFFEDKAKEFSRKEFKIKSVTDNTSFKQNYMKNTLGPLKPIQSLDKKIDLDFIDKLNAIKQTYLTLVSNKNERHKSFFNEVFPKGEIFRFLVERYRWKEGLANFENNTPGYFKALGKAFFNINENEPLTIGLIKSFHKTALTGAQDYSLVAPPPGEFKQWTNYYILDYRNITLEGMLELFEKMKNSQETVLYKIANISQTICDATNIDSLVEEHGSLNKVAEYLITKIYNQKGIYLKALIKNKSLSINTFPSKTIEATVQGFINEYESNIREAKNSAEILRAIVVLVRDCEQFHPFADGNCRTFAMVLLSYLCMKNGFPPSILDNPNHFDGFSINQLMSISLIGMEDTLNVAQGAKQLYDITIEDLLDNPLDRALAENLDFMQEALADYRKKHNLEENSDYLQNLLTYRRLC